MKKIIILLLLSTLLLAQNPKVYSALGDAIYDNAEKIEKLKKIEKFSSFHEKIDSYVIAVAKAKNDGFAIERGSKDIDKKAYLEKLRELAKTNDFFLRSVNSSFEYSISSEDNLLFSQMVNSALIDTEKNKSTIINYYLEHSEEINATGVIQKYLDEDKALQKERENRRKLRVTAKELEKAKIKRIRKNDKEKQEALQKSLEAEVLRKKTAIRKNQIKELAD